MHAFAELQLLNAFIYEILVLFILLCANTHSHMISNEGIKSEEATRDM